MKRLKQWLVFGIVGTSIVYIKEFVFLDVPDGELLSFVISRLLIGVLVGLGFYILEPLFRWRTWRKGGKLGPPWPFDN